MSNDGPDDKNVNNEQAQTSLNTTISDNQGQKEKTNDNNESLKLEAVTSPSNANISGEQNTAQINNESDKVLGAEGATNDPVGIEQNETNNKQEQSSLGPNIGDTQNQEASVNANKEAPSKQEGEQAAKVNIVGKEEAIQGGNAPNEAKEQIIANKASTEPENKNVDKDLEQLLSRIDKGEPPQKLEDAQVKNVLGAIKAQLTATANPAELERLASAAASLASSTNNPEILEQIKGI
ncbi:MAG: hypothetical protein ACEY3D_08850 [Rickettsia sp.]|uniref:hypothetical protein n=1 Tax=Rickettsia sp. TaxID=789 RepID=UPI0039785DDE